MRLHPDKRNRPIDFSLTTDDIEYCQPTKGGLDWPRHTNPLDPNYQLPSFQTKPITPPKFLRDPIPVSDIEGTQVKTLIDTSKPAREAHLSVRDIDGTWPDYMRMKSGSGFKYTTGNPKPFYNLETADIVAPFGRVACIRNTNPLEPEYSHRISTLSPTLNSTSTRFDSSLEKIGYIEGSRPRMRARELKNTVCNINKADDIELAYPQRFVGSIPFNIESSPSFKREFIGPKDPHDTIDIEGAQAMTLAKGIEKTTRRHLNPLLPQYTWDQAPNKRPPPGPACAPATYLPDYDIVTGIRYLRPRPGMSEPTIAGHVSMNIAKHHQMSNVIPAGSSYFANPHIQEEFNMNVRQNFRDSPANFCVPGTVPHEFAPSIGGYQRSLTGSAPNNEINLGPRDEKVSSAFASGCATPSKSILHGSSMPSHLMQPAGKSHQSISNISRGSRSGSIIVSNNNINNGAIGKSPEHISNTISKATAMLLQSAMQPDAQSLRGTNL